MGLRHPQTSVSSSRLQHFHLNLELISVKLMHNYNAPHLKFTYTRNSNVKLNRNIYFTADILTTCRLTMVRYKIFYSFLLQTFKSIREPNYTYTPSMYTYFCPYLTFPLVKLRPLFLAQNTAQCIK